MLEVIKNALWSPLTVLNLALVGIAILFVTKFFTLLKLPQIFCDTVLQARKNRKAFGLMCTSLGGTIGVGNAIGVAGAIIDGGAGAVFWMAVASILGMAIKYAEVYLSLYFKGHSRSFFGPIAYIEAGIGSKAMSFVYAFLCLGVSFGMGNLSQVKSALISLDGIMPIPEYVLSFILAIAFLYVALGGIDKIRSFSEIAVPFISLSYILLLTVILYKQRAYISDAFSEILSGSGVVSGIKWSVIKSGITSGFSKAIFSSEAGLGSAGFAHSASNTEPCEQAKWGVVEVFVDALICIMTALALLTFSARLSGAPETFMTRGIFALSFGKAGEIFYSVSMLIFAFSSLICWYYNGACALSYIKDGKGVKKIYCCIFATLIFLASFIGDSIIIDLSDIANALMMIVNVSALWVLVFKIPLTF